MLFKPVAVAAFVTLALANPLPAGEADACASVHCTEGTARVTALPPTSRVGARLA